MPRRLTRTDVRTMLPQATAAIAHLTDTGHSDLAQAVQVITDYATRAADQADRAEQASSEANGRNRNIKTTKVFHEHFLQSSAAAGKPMTEVIVARFEDYAVGKWRPEPFPRLTRNSKPEMADINVRVTDDLWQRVEDTAVRIAAAGGAKVTARRLALAALRDEFGLPDEA